MKIDKQVPNDAGHITFDVGDKHLDLRVRQFAAGDLVPAMSDQIIVTFSPDKSPTLDSYNAVKAALPISAQTLLEWLPARLATDDRSASSSRCDFNWNRFGSISSGPEAMRGRSWRMRFSCVRVTVFFGPDSTLQVEAGNSAADVNNAGRRFIIDPGERNQVPIVVEALGKLKAALEDPKGNGIEMATSGRFIVRAQAAISRIDVNLATHAELTTLPGVGPETAKATDWRPAFQFSRRPARCSWDRRVQARRDPKDA